MNIKKQLTKEEMELVRAYNRDYQRRYRKEHAEQLKQNRLNYQLRKAKAAVAAGLLEMPAADQEQRPAAESE